MNPKFVEVLEAAPHLTRSPTLSYAPPSLGYTSRTCSLSTFFSRTSSSTCLPDANAGATDGGITYFLHVFTRGCVLSMGTNTPGRGCNFGWKVMCPRQYQQGIFRFPQPYAPPSSGWKLLTGPFVPRVPRLCRRNPLSLPLFPILPGRHSVLPCLLKDEEGECRTWAEGGKPKHLFKLIFVYRLHWRDLAAQYSWCTGLSSLTLTCILQLRHCHNTGLDETLGHALPIM